MNIIMSRALNQHHSPLVGGTPPPLTPSSPLDFTEKIPFKELRLSNETLGSGSFGTVFKGYWRGRSVAVKQFRTREEIDSFLVEVKQLSCVKHPNIVTLFGSSVQHANGTAYLVMEYAEGGSLNHLLHECRQQQYDLRHACIWASQTARGVTYLHEMKPKPIMHRDLKPANLLLFNRGKILKICDFGTACTVKTQMTNNTGSASYMAPEVFATSSYLVSGDVYSWSIIFWEILARLHPYSQQCSNPYQILWRVKQDGTRPLELIDCPKIIWDLIARSWDKDPQKRPSMRQVACEMDFISSFIYKTSSSATPTITTTSNSHTTTSSGYANYVSENMIHHQNINIQPRRLSSAYESHQMLLSSPYQNLSHLHQILPHSAFDSRGTPEDRSPSTTHKKELTYHRDALRHRLALLKKQVEELEMTTEPEERTPNDVILEIENLQKEERKKMDELKQRSQSIKSLVKNFNNGVCLNSSGSIDCE